jgi:hypothetical protein
MFLHWYDTNQIKNKWSFWKKRKFNEQNQKNPKIFFILSNKERWTLHNDQKEKSIKNQKWFMEKIVKN